MGMDHPYGRYLSNTPLPVVCRQHNLDTGRQKLKWCFDSGYWPKRIFDTSVTQAKSLIVAAVGLFLCIAALLRHGTPRCAFSRVSDVSTISGIDQSDFVASLPQEFNQQVGKFSAYLSERDLSSKMNYILANAASYAWNLDVFRRAQTSRLIP